MDEVIPYVDGEVHCSIHSEIADDEGRDDEEGVEVGWELNVVLR
ncbi:hypothetical protein NVV31_17200 [Cytobacillus firmus]|nr:hypothetical protein [Cytobacillus firmus]MCU1807125.1 hypothetical protein [Cytobacillus firmus]